MGEPVLQLRQRQQIRRGQGPLQAPQDAIALLLIPQEFAKGCIALSIAEGYNEGMPLGQRRIERGGQDTMKDFARVTKLGNISGRADYISNPARQEEILVKSEPVDWTPYHQYELAHQKTSKANNEGREVVVALPNEWAKLPPSELFARVKKMAEIAAGKDTDLQWAVHWNKARSNLHFHVIFSERTRLKEAGVYDRDIYLKADGKVARCKADRAKFPDGSYKPPVHRKGEPKGDFGPKDTRYKSRSWPEQVKTQLREQLRAYGAEIVTPAPFHEYHEGKGKDAPAIRAKNAVVREQNRLFVEYREKYPEIPEKTLRRVMLQDVRRSRITEILRDGKQFSTVSATLREHRNFGLVRDLLAAHNDLLTETYLLKDTRRPPNAAVLAQPEKIRGLVEQLEAAHGEYQAAIRQQTQCGFFDFSGKKAAKADTDRAYSRYAAAVEKLAPYTSTPKITAAGADYKMFLQQGKEAVNRAAAAAASEKAHARPDGLPTGSPEARRQALERFTALCRKVPPELREKVLGGFDSNAKAFSGPSSLHTAQAKAEVEALRRQILPAKQEQQRAQQHTQQRTKRHDFER